MSALAAKNAGNELFKKGDFAAAWQKYDEAHQLDPKDVVFLANRAQCELKLEQYGSAIASCDAAIVLDEAFVKVWYRRALANSALLQYSKAVRDLQRVVALAPDFPQGRSKLAEAQRLARFAAFQAAIKADDEPSVFETLDFDAMPEFEGEKSKISVDLDNLDDDTIERVVQHFKDAKPLPRRTLLMLVKRVAAILEKEPTMNEISTESADNESSDVRLTICGDTHGQFYDVLHIFETNGWPSETHEYLFNGDFVDRGSWSTEVVILLYLLKLRWPRRVWLNRGNHETDGMNTAYGFSGECKAKYTSTNVFRAFSESFSMLPLATLVNNDYFVVHGGIFSKPGVTLNQIRKIDRFATKQPPQSGLIMEMLWADPQEGEGIGPSKRGIGHEFGPDVTAAFVEENGLRAVIRSHEVRQAGYQEEHDGKLVTIFSAPNYCDNVGNRGAYINVGKDGKLKFQQFDASWHPAIPPMAYAAGLVR